MKKSRIIFIVFLAILNMFVLHAQNPQIAFKPITIAGQWKFKLDSLNVGMQEEWFKSKLTQNIELPGSCEQRGYGIQATKPAVGKLTRVIRYEGKAWYQKEIEIQKDWKGQRIELFLERCHWESNVWIDGRSIGMQNSLSAPHIYDLGILKPGKHLLTICIDNTYKIPIGTWAHAITEDTQGNWNGIIGRMQLTATGLVWIKNVQVYPDFLKIDNGNQNVEEKAVEIQAHKFKIPAGSNEV